MTVSLERACPSAASMRSSNSELAQSDSKLETYLFESLFAVGWAATVDAEPKKRRTSRSASAAPDEACVPRPTRATPRAAEYRSRDRSCLRLQSAMSPYPLSPPE